MSVAPKSSVYSKSDSSGPSGGSTVIDRFLDAVWLERGLSPNTLSAYRRDLLDFAVHVARDGSALKKATRDHIAGYRAVANGQAGRSARDGIVGDCSGAVGQGGGYR